MSVLDEMLHKMKKLDVGQICPGQDWPPCPLNMDSLRTHPLGNLEIREFCKLYCLQKLYCCLPKSNLLFMMFHWSRTILPWEERPLNLLRRKFRIRKESSFSSRRKFHLARFFVWIFQIYNCRISMTYHLRFFLQPRRWSDSPL